ncbi:hypothetical protein J2T02_001264 [Chitinophaga terrae (ex Kim and Jung 2007)]|uniref:DUF5977 domain-containing protein n=1 Tax=Chitinophaga terrae (ex Kim and Jung 2007) TaxID=408074 RepID=UPI0027804E9B|nr:DUF5977 domain-containing protein [Chitinophaga terrae (ex Kim and Jung 2007)]MDQ0106170.1 hypothetical protein [Chitinophaga terrae (ex Kim and Jung 2007)]
MILAFVARGKKCIASCLLVVIYLQILLPLHLRAETISAGLIENKHLKTPASTYVKVPALPTGIKTTNRKSAIPEIVGVETDGGPTQPEMEAFHSVGADNMVDLFTGDFSYSIPLLDVGGYPVTLGYNSGISMDQEASWVGLGWNVNPGSITRNLRGLPDDFTGSSDFVTKEVTMKKNKTMGVNAGLDLEVAGLPTESFGVGLDVGFKFGIFHNTYRGFGMETGFNAGLSVGNKSKGRMTYGLSFDNNSQTGITLGTSLSHTFGESKASENPYVGSVSISTGYNSRAGLTSLQVSGGVRKYVTNKKNETSITRSSGPSASISFANPAFTPTMNVAYTNKMMTVTLKVGSEATVLHPSVSLSGYISEQYIADKDKRLTLPAYGYLNYEAANGDYGALLDFNREKDIPYRDAPPVPTIAIPSYTYDVFSMTGEGVGGSFRAYRNDIGYVYDHEMTTRDVSGAASLDFGAGFIAHAGADLFYTRAYTKSSLWDDQNFMRNVLGFRTANGKFEPAYFRSPGEKTINATSFYDAMGGDRVVTAKLSQPLGFNTGIIYNTPYLTPYAKAEQQDDILLTPANTIKPEREKRTQVITYLTAKEASEVGLSKYIEYYPEDTFTVKRNKAEYKDEYIGDGDGLLAKYYYTSWFQTYSHDTWHKDIAFFNKDQFQSYSDKKEYFSLKLLGKLKVPFSGIYNFKLRADDGMKLFINGVEFISDLNEGKARDQYATIPLEGGKLYNIETQYNNVTADAELQLSWQSDKFGDNEYKLIPPAFFFLEKDRDVFRADSMYKEKRVNRMRKENHISEIDVLNPDGRRYVYGIPVYNISQKETTFSVDKSGASPDEGLVSYTPNVDDTLSNTKGKDWYYNAEFMPAYAHSFLLTGILSPDYVDVTGNGISDDDAGNAIRFNYTKTADLNNPYKWRAPYTNKATYNEGFKTDNRDDKGSYVSGTKELYYLHSIESKSMVAVFRLEKRKDLLQMDAQGNKSDGGARRLKRIDLYIKADFIKNGSEKAIPVKSVHFEYSYELCKGINHSITAGDTTSGKLTLKEVWFSYNGNEKGKKNPYRFRYNKLNPNYAFNKYDRWGNYKDQIDNPGSTPGNLVNNADYPYALQDSALAAANAAAWTLDTIILPSGGMITVDYESDDYGYVQNKHATQMYQLYGFANKDPLNIDAFTPKLYDNGLTGDNLYVAVKVPYVVKSSDEIISRYLDGLDKIYFRLAVKMPSDKYGSGIEYVPCYANIASYGAYFPKGASTIIYFKVEGITQAGLTPGDVSPLTKTALQYLKLNLPSKAYPGSEAADDLGLEATIKMLYAQVDNVNSMLAGFDKYARIKQYVRDVDTTRSLVRLNNPNFKKYGGGLRVKRIKTYDNWSKMTGQRAAVYGKEYSYTTTKEIDGEKIVISSGVASYEPLLGGEENPWRKPIEYVERVAALAPTTVGYVEEPLGESFFPAPSVGYSKVRIRTINAKNNRSVNGYDETCFYTTKDFPTITERTVINDHNKKRYREPLKELLRVNSKHFIAVSQGFKVELNDMNGKLRSQASYAEGDDEHPIAYTENFYRVDDPSQPAKHLNNKVLTINPKGKIETSEVGKDMELMFDMRQEKSVTIGANVSVNVDFFTAGIWPILIPSLIPLPQYEENIFRSVAATKVINRHGILDSVMVVDKGSRVVTHNLLYDTETGDPVLTSVQNEYNDRVYNFTYPAGWIYEGMAGAYKNIGTVLSGLTIKEGRITGGLTGKVGDYFFNGDEILAYTKIKVAGTECAPTPAYWPGTYKVWAVDANMLNGKSPDIYFVNQDGTPFTGNDVKMKIVRSGRRNIAAVAGTVTMLKNPLVGNQLVLDDNSQVVNASMVDFKQFWKVPDRQMPAIIIDTFRNVARTDTFTVTCGANTQRVPVTIAAGKFTSVESQEKANEMARNFLQISGPATALRQIGCTYYYNTEVSMSFRKQCSDPNAIGEWVQFVVKAKTDSSLINVEDANQKAKARLQAEGPAYANSHGRCYYLSDPVSGPFTRSCPPGKSAFPVTYSLPRGADTSYISQSYANSKAAARLAVEGPAYAQTHSYCTYYAKLKLENMVSEDSDLNNTATYIDVVVYFYEDEACTIAASADSLPVTIQVTETINNDYNSGTFIENYERVANGTRAEILKHAPKFQRIFKPQRGKLGSITNISYGYKLIIDSNYNVIVK